MWLPRIEWLGLLHTIWNCLVLISTINNISIAQIINRTISHVKEIDVRYVRLEQCNLSFPVL